VYHLDRDQAVTAGLLHDAAKDLTSEEYEQIVIDAGIQIYYPCDRDYTLYLHGPVGAQLVARRLNISDPLTLDAIKLHTFYGDGEYFEHPLVWCLRFSDLLEPSRNWHDVRVLREGAARLRKTVYSGRMAEGAFLQTGWLIQWFDEDGKPVHPNMRKMYQKLANQLNLDEKFLD
jgi:HD superfamily phosphohydrolase YqeK